MGMKASPQRSGGIMRATRLAHAIETGALVLPEAGRIAVFRPAPDDDLSALPAARVSVVTSDRVAQAAFAAQGLAVARRAEPGQALVPEPRRG